MELKDAIILLVKIVHIMKK